MRLNRFLILALACGLLALARPTFAQSNEGLTLSITPPLFKVNMEPGGTWASEVKVINNNAYPVTVYAQALDFKSGNNGGVEFIKADNASAGGGFFSNNINLTKEPIEIPAFGSQEVPFIITLPPDVGPGGHYAAILVGSEQTQGQGTGSTVKVTSKLASLLLVRVAGEVVEKGDVKEFSVKSFFAKNGKSDFVVRFGNDGNVHLRPEGEIKISNVFGKTLDIIPINQRSEFGNVLPVSERKWDFSWESKDGLLNLGLLKADLILNFGDTAVQSRSRSLRFWTIDQKTTFVALGVIVGIFILFVLLLRYYIHRSVASVGRDIAAKPVGAKTIKITDKNNLILSKSAPADGGANKSMEEQKMGWSLFKKISVLAVVILVALGGAFYFGLFDGGTSRENQKAIEEFDAKQQLPTVTIIGDGATTTPPVPEVATTTATTTDLLATTTATSTLETATSTDAATAATSTTATTSPLTEAKDATTDKAAIKLSILNGSGTSGVGAKASKLVEAEGYKVGSVGNAKSYDYAVTEIQYGKGQAADAELIDKALGGGSKLIESTGSTDGIIVTLGKNFSK
ncbi:hypothetical protein HGA64_00560 [Candidatus Falkowbacteria bacterium]|nr:hypothetical protein [Candidatus Falkowbacteria bacterium]